MNKRWSILLALLLMLTMTVSAYASGDAAPVSGEEQLRPVYEAYLGLLQEKQGDIESYWHSQAVALSDITGDGIPELFYMQPGEYTLTTLHIAGFRDGALTWLYADESTYWDGQVGGGFAHCLFKVEGDTALYAYLRPSFEGEGHIGFWRFTEREDGTLERTPVCEEAISVDYTNGYSETVTYLADGAETTAEGYLAKAGEIGSRVTEVFQSTMSSWADEGLPGQSDLQAAGRAMSCGEAIGYLQTLLAGEGPQGEAPAPPAAAESADPESWLGKWYASTGESLDIYDVTDTGLSVSYRIMYEVGDKMASLYELKFDDESRTSATLTGDGFDGWTFTFLLGDGYITVQSEIPDQVFVKNDGTDVVPFWDMLRVTGDGVTVRTGPGTDYEVIGPVSRDEQLEASGKIGSWYQVDYYGTTGYIIEDYVVESGWFAVDEDSGTLTVTKDQAVLRAGPAIGYENLGSVSAGTALTVTGRHGRWYQVDYYGREVFILGDDVSAGGEAAAETPVPEAPTPKTLDDCVFMKDGQAFYMDNMAKTPIYITDIPTSAYADDSKTERDIAVSAFGDWWCRRYTGDQVVLYSTFDSTGSPANDLWIKDVSSPDGEARHIADEAIDIYTCYDPDENAVYYTVYEGPDDGFVYDEYYVKYRYDTQTGETAVWEEGGAPEDSHDIASSTEKLHFLYGVDIGRTNEMQEGEELLAEYPSGAEHFLKVDSNDYTLGHVYYWDGSTETYLCDISGLYSTTVNRNRQMAAFVSGHDRGVLLLEDQAIELQPLFAEGTSIYEVRFSADGGTGYCMVVDDEGNGERGLYKFAVYEDGIGPMELIDPDIAVIKDKYYVSRASCWTTGDDIYYVHRDASLCCNGHVVDPTGGADLFIGFCGDDLMYAAFVQSSDGRYNRSDPFTLRSADTQSYRNINDCVIDHILGTDSMWYVGDYDYWSGGTLYLYVDGVSVPLVSGVSAID